MLSDNTQPVHLPKLPLEFTITKACIHIVSGGWAGSGPAFHWLPDEG